MHSFQQSYRHQNNIFVGIVIIATVGSFILYSLSRNETLAHNLQFGVPLGFMAASIFDTVLPKNRYMAALELENHESEQGKETIFEGPMGEKQGL